jgi:putative transcriptional regulator
LTELPSEAHPDAVTALLAGYVAGTLLSPVRALVEAHLELSARNHRIVDDLECVAAKGLEEIEPVAIRDREACLGRICALDADPAPEPAGLPASQAGGAAPPCGLAEAELPAALRRYLGRGLDAARWRTLVPGLEEWQVGDDGGCTVRFVRARAGLALPAHTHDGTEVTLVLKGAYRDELGHHVAGDLVVADEDIEHRPVVEAGEDCLCLVVADGHARLTGPLGRLVAPFRRI